MPLIALVSLAMMFGGVVYSRDERPDIRRYAKTALVAGAVGTTAAAMAAFGPIVALCVFAAFVAVSFFTQFWS